MKTPLAFQIKNRLNTVNSYSKKGDKILYYFANNPDTFISNTQPESDSKNSIKIYILYEGKTKNIPKELLDKLLVSSDSSYNPMRPFRWYHYTEFDCADTNDEKSVERVRQKSFSYLLEKIENPDYIWLYEVWV